MAHLALIGAPFWPGVFAESFAARQAPSAVAGLLALSAAGHTSPAAILSPNSSGTFAWVGFGQADTSTRQDKGLRQPGPWIGLALVCCQTWMYLCKRLKLTMSLTLSICVCPDFVSRVRPRSPGAAEQCIRPGLRPDSFWPNERSF